MTSSWKAQLFIENWTRNEALGNHTLIGVVDGGPHESDGLIRFEPDRGQAESHAALYVLGKPAKVKK